MGSLIREVFALAVFERAGGEEFLADDLAAVVLTRASIVFTGRQIFGAEGLAFEQEIGRRFAHDHGRDGSGVV